MNGKERITAILDKRSVDRVGFWLGNPADETREIYYEYFGIKDSSTSPSESKGENKSLAEHSRSLVDSTRLRLRLL